MKQMMFGFVLSVFPALLSTPALAATAEPQGQPDAAPQAVMPPLPDRLLPCMRPADATNFSAIVAACGAVLEDANASLNNQQAAAVYTARGNAYDEMHDAAHARSDYDAGLAADPTNSLSYFNRGLFLKRQKDIDAAKADFVKAVALNDAIVPAHLLLGEMAYDKGDYAAALQQFDDSIRLNPDQPTLYIRRGVTLMKLGQKDKGVADLENAVTLDPGLADRITVDEKPLTRPAAMTPDQFDPKLGDIEF